MSSNTTLNPCPFCGGPADSETTVTEVTIFCENCPAKMVRPLSYGESDDDAIEILSESWNHRTCDE